MMTLVKVNNRPAFNTFDGLVKELFGKLDPNYQAQFSTNQPPANVVEAADGYHMELAAPGRMKENFKLNVEANFLVISYTQPTDAEAKPLKQVINEFSTGNFKRTFTLNKTVNAEAILAKYENGLLKVFLPKKEEVKPTVQQIAVS